MLSWFLWVCMDSYVCCHGLFEFVWILMCAVIVSVSSYWFSCMLSRSLWVCMDSYVCCHGLYEFVCVPVLSCIKGTVSLKSSTASRSYHLPASASTWTPEPWWKRFTKDACLWLSAAGLLTTCKLSACGSLCQPPTANSLSGEGCMTHWPMGGAGGHWGVVLVQVWVRQNPSMEKRKEHEVPLKKPFVMDSC